MRLVRFAVAAAALITVCPIALAKPMVRVHRSSDASATVTHAGATWQVTYRFRRNASGWVFPVSAPQLAGLAPWRERAWRVISPGVRIERQGAYDLLVGTEGRPVPRTVQIAFTPTVATLDREYDPAIAFSNGPVALYSDQFDVAPTDDPGHIAQLTSGLSVADLGGRALSVQFHDSAGPVFVRGRLEANPVLTGAETYVIFGGAAVESIDGIALLADPALPTWLKHDAAGFAPRVSAFYTSRLGERNDPRPPLLLMAWRGPTRGKVVTDGGARSGEIILNFEGEGLVERNERATRRMHWFIAHEVAHFWLGTAGVAARSPADEWITEGGAEMMAFTLLAKTDHDWVLSELQRAVDDCVRLGGKPVAGAGARHESRALYACGTVIALGAVSAMRHNGGGDYFDFLRPFLTSQRSDRVVGAEDWFGRMTAVAQNAMATDAIRTLVEVGSSQPVDLITTILDRAGVMHSRKGDMITLSPDVI